MHAKTPGKTPSNAALADEALRTARRAMRLVAALPDADTETYLTARASALGLLTVHAKLTGKPDPRELHRRTN